MMQQPFPGIYIEHGISERTVYIDSYSTLFLSFTVGTQCDRAIVLNSLLDINKYSFLHEDYALTKSIKIYFANGGKRLYLLSQPTDETLLFNQDKYIKYLSNRCDTIIDIETIVAVDLFDKPFTKEQYIEIQNSISTYCEQSSRISISDLPQQYDEEYHKNIYNTVSFYPWLIDKERNLISSAIYASALFNKVALDENISLSIANRVLESALESSINLKQNRVEALYREGVTPIIYFRDEGYKIWGVRTLNFENEQFKYLNTLRVFRYIKRMIYQIAKQYIFEPNNYDLKNRMLRQIKSFLMPMWKNGALQGALEEEAFMLLCDERNNSIEDENAGRLNIHIAVSISKPLEYIVIHLNRVQNDHNHANINIS
jgi:hypothetical protein